MSEDDRGSENRYKYGSDSFDHQYRFFLQKLRPVRKDFVKRQGLALVNELTSFISQIYGIGPQHKFNEGYATAKFKKVGEKKSFATDLYRSILRSMLA